MAEKKQKDAVPAKVEETSTAMAAYQGLEEFAGQGFQNQTNEDIAIPFINVLQPNSPEVQQDGIEGAKAGMLFNSVTQELHNVITFVPALTQHVYVEWRPRTEGGGIVATHPIHSEVVKHAKSKSTEFGKYKTEMGNDLVETFYVFGILCDGDVPTGMAVMAFTSTKIKAYKAIMGRLNAFQLALPDGRRINPPLFAHTLMITTKGEKNNKGSFYVPIVQAAVENDVQKSLLTPTDPRFKMAAECQRLVDSGKAKADTAGQEPRHAADEDADEVF
jgi:hypothetical protein